ncbi:hypothetical protein NDU88_007312 [Pleurodeles waltl]|uniref:Retrotransposon gag domain-containing protein n=1 Tax=Pleurodeles waltl TaxID=8319 RepID=A0AAV7VQ37_PLEWA|nr:hypothetical protein NDU88_007312 [Pleurodeles waltl]
MVVHLGGKHIYRIAKTINEAEPKTHLTLIAALRMRFAPMVNVDYERFIFRQARQSADESIDMFYLRLKELATTCAFHNENDKIRGQIIQGCASSKLRERILEESGRPLQDILTMGRTKELSKARASHMEVSAVIGASSKPKTQKTLSSTKTCGSFQQFWVLRKTLNFCGVLNMSTVLETKQCYSKTFLAYREYLKDIRHW